MAQLDDTIRRLRDQVGVLDLAVLIATDVICEHNDHGLSKIEWQRRLLAEASQRLAAQGVFPGRFSLFSDDELRVLREQGSGDDSVIGDTLGAEVEFEFARRGLGSELLREG